MANQFNHKEELLTLLKKFFKDSGILGIVSKMPVKYFSKGALIYTADEVAESLFFLLEGTVKLTITSEAGREMTKTILNPGQFFGEQALLQNEKRRDTAIAMEECVVMVFTRDKFLSLVHKHPTFGASVLLDSTNKISRMEKKLETLLFLDTKSRIIAYLLELIESRGERIGYEWVVRNITTHQDIANLTATSRQSVTMTLNELRDTGIITFDRRRLLVRNLDKLRKMTEF